jgi:hypothetical protein
VTRRGGKEVEWKLGLCPKRQPNTPLDESPRLHTPCCDVLTLRMIRKVYLKSGSNLEKRRSRKSEKRYHFWTPRQQVEQHNLGLPTWGYRNHSANTPTRSSLDIATPSCRFGLGYTTRDHRFIVTWGYRNRLANTPTRSSLDIATSGCRSNQASSKSNKI